jgi:hypothetical protein
MWGLTSTVVFEDLLLTSFDLYRLPMIFVFEVRVKEGWTAEASTDAWLRFHCRCRDDMLPCLEPGGTGNEQDQTVDR